MNISTWSDEALAAVHEILVELAASPRLETAIAENLAVVRTELAQRGALLPGPGPSLACRVCGGPADEPMRRRVR